MSPPAAEEAGSEPGAATAAAAEFGAGDGEQVSALLPSGHARVRGGGFNITNGRVTLLFDGGTGLVTAMVSHDDGVCAGVGGCGWWWTGVIEGCEFSLF